MMHQWTKQGKTGIFVIAALVCGMLAFPGAAQAQCENSITATSRFNQLAKDIVRDLEDFWEQEQNFLDDKVTRTATKEVLDRMDEFDRNTTGTMSRWAREFYIPALQEMTKQLTMARIDQSRVLGSLTDASLVMEQSQKLQQREAEAARRYRPNEMSCQIDTAGPGQTKAYEMARAVTAASGRDAVKTVSNTAGTPAAKGFAANQKAMWDEYVAMFCDPAKGGQGCTTPGTHAGQHIDLPKLLWGDKQTIDMSLAGTPEMVAAIKKYLITPQVADTIPSEALASSQGQEEMIQRRAYAARVNAVHNVVGQMIAERIGGSGVSTVDMRVASGLPPAAGHANASYREIQTAMSKDRFHNPQYAIRMVQDPEQLVREQGAINATRLQQMNDLYKRMEEMVFMEAAMFAADLDARRPDGGSEGRPVR